LKKTKKYRAKEFDIFKKWSKKRFFLVDMNGKIQKN